MTKYGKAFVVLITFSSFFFLALATAVKTSTPAWKDLRRDAKKALDEANGSLAKAEEDKATREKELETARAQHKADLKSLQDQEVELTNENQRRQAEIAEARKAIEAAQGNAKTALQEGEEQTKQFEQRRAELAAVEAQKKAFRDRQGELDDEIALLMRELAVVSRQNAELRSRTGGGTTPPPVPAAPAP